MKMVQSVLTERFPDVFAVNPNTVNDQGIVIGLIHYGTIAV